MDREQTVSAGGCLKVFDGPMHVRGSARGRGARIVCVIGTRPEVIKMAPVIHHLKRMRVPAFVLSTSQHRELLHELVDFFGITIDRDLDVMTANQSLSALSGRLITALGDTLTGLSPKIVVAQGDTNTVMATAVACFYNAIPFAHVEAGLRTGDLRQPFPEEFNRVVVSQAACLHFAPTERARNNLLREGISERAICLTGNTAIDALHWTAARKPGLQIPIGTGRRVLLVTLHRRESLGGPLRDVFSALRLLACRNPDLEIVYPLHPNPRVSGPAQEMLGGIERVHLCPPFDYAGIVAAMQRADLVLTDSGGIQEEAPALGRPVLVARETTERPETVEAGVARLVGTATDKIVAAVQELLDDPRAYAAMARGVSPYGDGHAGRRIAEILESFPNSSGARGMSEMMVRHSSPATVQ